MGRRTAARRRRGRVRTDPARWQRWTATDCAASRAGSAVSSRRHEVARPGRVGRLDHHGPRLVEAVQQHGQGLLLAGLEGRLRRRPAAAARRPQASRGRPSPAGPLDQQQALVRAGEQILGSQGVARIEQSVHQILAGPAAAGRVRLADQQRAGLGPGVRETARRRPPLGDHGVAGGGQEAGVLPEPGVAVTGWQRPAGRGQDRPEAVPAQQRVVRPAEDHLLAAHGSRHGCSRLPDEAEAVQHREQRLGDVERSVRGEDAVIVGLAAHGRHGVEGLASGDLLDRLQDAGTGVPSRDLVRQPALGHLQVDRVLEVAGVQGEAGERGPLELPGHQLDQFVRLGQHHGHRQVAGRVPADVRGMLAELGLAGCRRCRPRGSDRERSVNRLRPEPGRRRPGRLVPSGCRTAAPRASSARTGCRWRPPGRSAAPRPRSRRRSGRTRPPFRPADRRSSGPPSGRSAGPRPAAASSPERAGCAAEPRSAPPSAASEPLLRQVQRGAEHVCAGLGPQRDRDGDLTTGDLPQRPAGLPGHADRACALFGKLVPLKINRPSRSGITARKRRQTASASHGALVMKCWKA